MLTLGMNIKIKIVLNNIVFYIISKEMTLHFFFHMTTVFFTYPIWTPASAATKIDDDGDTIFIVYGVNRDPDNKKF